MRELPRIVGLCGHIGGGKDTAAQILHSKYGYTVRGFSDPVYQGVWELNPVIPVADGYKRLQEVVMDQGWDAAKRQNNEIRRLLRVYGTEAGREIHGQGCWVSSMANARANDTLTVIRDVRFQNEVGYIKACGGFIIHIVRDGCEAQGNHASEQLHYEDIADLRIANNGSLQDLELMIHMTFSHYQPFGK